MHPLPVEPSLGLVLGFASLSLAMAAAVAWRAGPRTGAGIAVWMGVTGLLGASGWLADFSLPPRPLIVLIPTLLGVFWLSGNARLRELPVAVLIGAQVFRVPVELLIHLAVSEGVAPAQLTWPPEGLNLDLLTGLTAPLVAVAASRLPRSALLAWNTAGLALVLWVVGVAILSMPTPFQQLEPDNVWVAYSPFVWLPVALVGSAILGHLLVYRRLLQT